MEPRPIQHARKKQFIVSIIGIIILLALGYLIIHFTNQGIPESLLLNPMEVMEDAPIIRSLETQAEPGASISDTQTNPASKCFIGGCSGEICSDLEGIASTCEYREEYTCYKTATCERQKATGKCGWTKTPELNKCSAIQE